MVVACILIFLNKPYRQRFYEMVNLGINGFNRAAEMIIRASTYYSEITVTAISDNQIDIDSIIYLIKYDSERGNYTGHIEKHSSDTIFFNGGYIRVFQQKIQDGIPWSLANVKYVVDVTGCDENFIASLVFIPAQFHLTSASVKKVIINSPIADIPLIVLGINHDTYKPDFNIISSASSSTYSLALLIKLLDDNFEVEHCTTTNINLHSSCFITSDSDCRKAKANRGCKNTIGPSITSDDTVKVIERLMPHLSNKLCGLSISMPRSNVSILDMTVKVKQNTSLSNIFKMVKKQSSNLLSVVEDTITASNVRGQRVSCILDKNSSIALNNKLFKLICWYDNEYSEACRILELIIFINKSSNIVSSLNSSIYQDNMLRTKLIFRKSISKYLLSNSVPNLPNVLIKCSDVRKTTNQGAQSKEVQTLFFSHNFGRYNYYSDNTIHKQTKASAVDLLDSSFPDGHRTQKKSPITLTCTASFSSLINQRLRWISKTIARKTNILTKSSHSEYQEHSDSSGTAGSDDVNLQIMNREDIVEDDIADDIEKVDKPPQNLDVIYATNTYGISCSSETVDEDSDVNTVSREYSNYEDTFSVFNERLNDSRCGLGNTPSLGMQKSHESTSGPSYLKLPVDDFADSISERDDDGIYEAYEILFSKKEVGKFRRNIGLNDNQQNKSSLRSGPISESMMNADDEFDKLDEICKWLEISNDFSDHEFYSILEKVEKSRCN